MKKFFNIFLVITLTYAESQVPQKNTTISATKTISTHNDKEEFVAEGVRINQIPIQKLNEREGYKQQPNKTTPKSVVTPIIETPHIIEHLENITNVTTNSDHKSIGRKGVNFNDTIIKPKKPTVTVPGDESFAPSHFESSKSNTSSKLTPKVPNVNILNNNQDNTQKYIVPIIIVILSVPFVAILISMVYKRGSEWWKYRHYRRMDFLINGMYDN